MKEFGEGNYTHAIAKGIRDYHNHYPYKDPITYDPLKVTNPEVIDGVQEELSYVWERNEVKNLIMYANEITLRVVKGKNSIRPPLSNTPSMTISVTERDELGNPIGKDINFRRLDKSCTFHYHKTSDGKEIILIGSNNLDSGYDEAIYGWVSTGMKLFKKALEKENNILRISIQKEYSASNNIDTEDSLSTSSANLEEKGPMEL